jgi:hypothetical protein
MKDVDARQAQQGSCRCASAIKANRALGGRTKKLSAVTGPVVSTKAGTKRKSRHEACGVVFVWRCLTVQPARMTLRASLVSKRYSWMRRRISFLSSEPLGRNFVRTCSAVAALRSLVPDATDWADACLAKKMSPRGSVVGTLLRRCMPRGRRMVVSENRGIE